MSGGPLIALAADKVVIRRLPKAEASTLASLLGKGRCTRDFPIDVGEARALGLSVSTKLPNEMRQLMRVSPQPRGRRPSVEYTPVPYEGRSRPRETDADQHVVA
jgi:hypothetical protein